MSARECIHLAYGTDNNYVFPTMVSAASAALYVSEDFELVIHLFDLGVADHNYHTFEATIAGVNDRVRVQRHPVDPRMFEGFADWRGSVATYARLFVQDLLPDLEWAIYVDGDTLWLGDIAELWGLRNPSFTVAASIDPPRPDRQLGLDVAWYRELGLDFKESEYFCAGLILLNLRKMRAENFTARCRDFLNKYPAPRIVDQTVLNYLCQGTSQLLPARWGVFSVWHGGVDLSLPSLVHYVRDVPWRRDKLNRLLSDVVMLWYYFCADVLELDLLPQNVPWWGRQWRRGIFKLLKGNQWALCHRYLRSRLRNTHGIPKAATGRIRADWQRLKAAKGRAR